MQNITNYSEVTNELLQLEVTSKKDEDTTYNMEELINLKFSVERQISTLHETFEASKKYKNMRYSRSSYSENSTANLDIYEVFERHHGNIERFGTSFLERQTELLRNIDEILLKLCDHNWIHDVIDEPLERSRNICYCGKCYCRKP